MTFYLKPPTGNISLSKLQEFSEKRLSFLAKAHECHGSYVDMKDLTESEVHACKSESIIAGTVKDGISHFILRMAFCNNPDLANFFIKAETDLFSFRFSCMDEEEKLKFFKSTQKHARQYQGYSGRVNEVNASLKVFENLGRSLTWKQLAHHCFEGSSDVFVKIPYTHALNLVAKRQVEIEKGIASVPCSRLHEVMTDLYKSTLREGIKVARQRLNETEDDVRMQRLFHRLQYIARQHCFSQSPDSFTGHVTSEEVDDQSDRFPLCMKHLHMQLRLKHRLNHHARIQYTLFLKEVGLPVHEAIKFWGQEYSQTCCHDNTCTHDWGKDEKRYTYNIRHLYGLEGSRINYRGHSCSAIQDSNLGAKHEGGCPFVNFDDKHLSLLLENEGLDIANTQEIKTFVSMNKAGQACKSHLSAVWLHKLRENCHDKLMNYSEKSKSESDNSPFCEMERNFNCTLNVNNEIQSPTSEVLDQDMKRKCHQHMHNHADSKRVKSLLKIHQDCPDILTEGCTNLDAATEDMVAENIESPKADETLISLSSMEHQASLTVEGIVLNDQSLVARALPHKGLGSQPDNSMDSGFCSQIIDPDESMSLSGNDNSVRCAKSLTDTSEKQSEGMHSENTCDDLIQHLDNGSFTPNEDCKIQASTQRDKLCSNDFHPGDGLCNETLYEKDVRNEKMLLPEAEQSVTNFTIVNPVDFFIQMNLSTLST